MRRFVLGTNRTTAAQDRAFLAILQERFPDVGWWHQLGETWLFVDHNDQLSTEVIREMAKEAFPDVYVMAIEVGNGRWSAFGEMSDFEWMHDSWQSS